MVPLTKGQWQAISPYLEQAMDLTGDERRAWLERLRETNPGLADEVQALLDEHAALDSEGFLDTALPSHSRPASLAGQTVGAYTIESAIGQGGMGSVWLARRSDGRFEGYAAIKFLNAALVGRGGEERFRREGSILARLTHPHIARLTDAGVSTMGQPYLVLEYLEGTRIDRYLRSAEPQRRGAAPPVPRRARRRRARARQPDRPSRHQTAERPGHEARRRQAAGFRDRQADRRGRRSRRGDDVDA